MNKRSSLSIRTHIMLLIVIMTIVPTGLIVFSALQQRNHDIQAANHLAERLVEEFRDDQNLLLSSAEQLLSTLSQIPAVQKHDSRAVNSLLVEMVKKNPQYSNLIIADKNGLQWAGAIPGKGQVTIADRRYFQNVMATGQFSSGEYAIGRAQNVPVINFAYPIKNASGNITGVAIVVFTLEKYNQRFKSKAIPANTSLFLTDYKGTTLFNLTAPEFVGRQDRDDLFRRMSEGPEKGTFEADSNIGIRRYFAYQKLRLRGEQTPYMYVRAGISAEPIFGKVRSKLLFDIGFMSIMLLLATGIAYYISKRGIVDKIIAMRDATQRVAQGDLDIHVSDYVSGGELGELGISFDAMARKLSDDITKRRKVADLLRKSEEKFRESERFLSTIIETEPECVKLLAADGSLLMMNRAGLDMIQAESFEQVQGKSIFPLIDPEYRLAFQAMIKDVFSDKPGKLEFKIVGAKGRPLWLETHSVPLRNDNGEIVSLLGITLNINERKEMDRMKDEMISAVSHEMRTPLTAMLGYIEFMMESKVDEVQTREYLGIVYKETKRLEESISNFLDMQRLRARHGVHHFKPLAVSPLLEEAATLFTIASNKHHITVDTIAELPLVSGNEEDLQTVVNNLLSNAIKYSPKGGNIVLGARREDGSVTLWVKDEGIGILQEEQDKIFGRFYRVDNSARRAINGTGLGLALVKEIVLAHGGRVWVESTLGKGSTFFISFPVASCDPEPLQIFL